VKGEMIHTPCLKGRKSFIEREAIR
jgi:hypothetical protein